MTTTTIELPADSPLASPPCSRFRVEERSGIVAIYDTEHDLYDDTPGCHGDYPWCVAYWTGHPVKDEEKGYIKYWEVDNWKIKRAHETCDLLNSLCENA